MLDASTPAPTTPEAPPPPAGTGDPVIDQALDELRRAGEGPLRERLDAGEHVHTVLHARLTATDED